MKAERKAAGQAEQIRILEDQFARQEAALRRAQEAVIEIRIEAEQKAEALRVFEAKFRLLGRVLAVLTGVVYLLVTVGALDPWLGIYL